MKTLWIWLLCVMLLFSGCTRVDDSADTTLPTVESNTPAEATEPTVPPTTEAPTEPGSEPVTEPTDPLLEGEPLTQDEVDWFHNEFFSPEMTDENGNQIFNIRNMFLLPDYDSVEEIDLRALFYDGVSWDSRPTQEELDRYREVSGDESQLDCTKIPKAEMEQLFFENTNKTIEETKKIGLDQLTYLGEYDAYYHMHGSSGYWIYTIKEGIRLKDGTVILSYVKQPPAYQKGSPYYKEGPVYKVTLAPYEGSYIFVSNDRGD